MKILYHHRTQGEEPESVHIACIVAALRQQGHEVDIVGPVKIGTAKIGEKSTKAAPKRSLLGRIKERLPRAVVELLQILYNLKSFLQVIGPLRSGRYAFLYERYALYNVAGVWAARWAGVPIILEVNTLYAQAWGKYYGLRFKRLARALERYAFRRADRLITVTEVQRKMLIDEGVDPERIVVSHNAIDPDDFRPDRFDGPAVRKELGLRPIVAGFVGTMNRWQGVHGFAEAVSQVCAARDDVSFLFVGDGEGRARLQEELERRGVASHAVFVGRQPHAAVARFVSAMDIGLLLDSNAYGSPMKVFEYWGMGKAVIAPRVAPVMEIMRDGETGLLIDPADAAAMARHILALAANPAELQRLGAAGREHVMKKHVWSQNAQAILEAYDGCREVGSAPFRVS